MKTKRKSVLLPVKRLGRGKYLRRNVSDPAKIARGEKLLAMWQKEWDEAERNPVRYAHVAWKSKKGSEEAEVKVEIRGIFFSEEAIEKKVKAKLEKWTGKIPYAKEVSKDPSPSLCLIKINKKPVKGIKYRYNPKKSVRAGMYGLGYHTTYEVGE